MRTIKFLTILVLSIFLSSYTNESNTTTLDNTVSKIEVLNFHSTHRCKTCNAIEANTKYTLKTYFAKQLKAGKITNKVINVDKEENEKIAEKFEAAGTALILNVIKNGKEKQINLTDFAFMKGNDQKAFSTALKAKIETELKKL
jgi:hypothetical protein